MVPPLKLCGGKGADLDTWRLPEPQNHETSDALAPSSFLLLVVMPGVPSSVLAPSSDARRPERSFLLLVVNHETMKPAKCPGLALSH